MVNGAGRIFLYFLNYLLLRLPKDKLYKGGRLNALSNC